MSTNVEIHLRGFDEASNVIKKVSDKIVGTQETIRTANNKVEKSSKEVALAFNNVATSGFALYNAIDRVQDMQVSVDRANLAVKTSLNAVEDAQRRYNTSVEKYGAASENAQAAAKDLQLAQERYQVATERADMMQGNLNEAMIQSAITVIPSLITMITSVSTLTAGWTTVTHGVSAALTFLQANPIMLVVAGIAALVAGLIWAYQNCEPFRNAVNALGAALATYLGPAVEKISQGLTWLWQNVLEPLIDVFNAITDNPILSFLLSFIFPITGLIYLFKHWEDVVKTLGDAWTVLANGISWAYNNVLKPVFDALAWVWNNVIKPIADVIGAIVGAVTGFVGGGTPSNQNPNVGGHLQQGGIVTRPTLTWVGEAGPEAVIPLGRGGFGTTLQINSPLITVQGSLDKRTADYAIAKMTDMLKNVLVESSSQSASSTHKRIRIGSRVS